MNAQIAMVFHRPALHNCLSLLAVSVLAGTTAMAQANATRPDRAGSSPGVAATAAEAHTCARCHAAVVQSYAENPHAQALTAAGGKGVLCASCHGPEKEHLESGGAKSKIVDPAQVPPTQTDDMCLTCHRGRHSTFDRSVHGRASLSCISCHSIHSAAAPKYLPKAAQLALCYKCHSDVKSQFSSPSRHNVAEGLIECTDCHDPHGTVVNEPAASAHAQDNRCTDCHTEIAGPSVFEHAVVKTEGCTACHFPHGGPNPHLLIRANVDAICQFCHFPAPDPKTGAHILRAKDQSGRLQPCTDCHTDVHGSNISPVFLRNK
jgi:DmsE family decaheme c-type cytochrome